MQPPNNAAAVREAREWLERAERDLALATQVLAGSTPLPEMTAYHAQQAAEKALKAYLTFRSTPFRRTHDLVELHGQCQALDTRFVEFGAAAETLNPYATRFRYPGGPMAPPPAEAGEALQLAERIVGFVRQQLP